MKLSLIVPIYNAEKYLAETIESIISQSGDYELILIDDGSKDSSLSICNLYASKDQRIKVYHIENNGVSNARNMGISIAQGEYIQFIDSDDKLVDGALKMIFSAITSNVDVILFSFKTFGNENNKYIIKDKYNSDYRKSIVELVTNGSIVACWNKVYKRSILEGKSFRVDLKYAEDYCFNLDVFSSVKSIFIISDVLYMYRKEGKSLSSSFDEKNFDVTKFIRKKSIDLLIHNGCTNLSAVERNYAYNMSLIIKNMVSNNSLNFIKKRKIIKKYCTLEYAKSVSQYYDGIYAKLLKTQFYTIILLYLLFINRNEMR